MPRTSLLAPLAVSIAALLDPAPADAARIETGAACTLADAIASANTNAAVGGCTAGAAGRDTVVLAGATTLSLPDNGANGLPVIVEDLVITSPDPADRSFIARDFTVGTPEFRLLEIGTATAAPAVTLRRITLQNGRARGTFTAGGVPVAGAGGCIRLVNGALTVVDGGFEECAAVGADNPAGPASDAWGGAIAATAGSLTIRGSSFALNAASGGTSTAAGASNVGGAAEGGAIFATGLEALTIRDSAISTNVATGGAGVDRAGNGRGGGLTVFGSEVTLTGVSFAANAAVGGGSDAGTSGIGLGGGFAVTGGSVVLRDGEVIDNVARGAASAAGRGGYANGGGLYASSGTVELAATGVLRNRAIAGAGPSAISDGVARGGGLYLSGGAVTADAVAVEENSATGAAPSGGGIAALVGAGPSASLVVTRSTIAGNELSATHGAGTGGGLYQEGSTLTIRTTGISGNAAGSGGGLYQAGGDAVVTLSALTGNSASSRGGAIAVDGGAFAGGAVELANVTVSGNSAGLEGGGIHVLGAPLAPQVARLTLGHVTLSANTGGGIQLTRGLTDPELRAANSILAAQATGADCTITGGALLTSGGGNLESATACGFTAASDRQSVADPGLAPLGDHGGATPSHDLLPGSPAIDAARDRGCNVATGGRDQRGLPRFQDGDGDGDFACDSGAVEAQGLLANPGFEAPLDPTADWRLTASGGGDGRARVSATPNGRFGLVLAANAAAESLAQTVALAGDAGEAYALGLLARGAGLPPGDALALTLRATLAGAEVDAATCNFAFPAADFTAVPRCELATTAAFDALEASAAWDGVPAGTLSLDAASLVRR
jgi:hypothetical protein